MNDLQMLIDEYREMGIEGEDVDWESVRDRLESDLDWTEQGAVAVVSIVRKYGSFMLRNAAALAGISVGLRRRRGWLQDSLSSDPERIIQENSATPFIS